MTCVVGLTAPDGTVCIGADSCGSSNDSWVHVPGPKVFQVEQRFLIGACGSFRALDLLRYSFAPGSQSPHITDDAFMRTVFVSTWRKLLLEEGFLHRENLRESGSNFMVGYRGRLYEVQPDFSVLNAPAWGLAIGTGEIAARGSLHTTRTDTDNQRRIYQALEAAEAITPSVRGPFLVMSVRQEAPDAG